MEALGKPSAGRLKSPILWAALSLVAIALATSFGPPERTLGSNVRLVYLHGVWVWAALTAFTAAGLAGLAAFVLNRRLLHQWSLALGRTGLFFWITYIPISMWAMQTNWNGLFLAEPRFRLAVIFAISGLLLQVGLALLEDPAWASAANLLFGVALGLALQNTRNVLHPPAPILESDAWRIQLFFGALFLLTLFCAWQIARWWFHLENSQAETFDD